MVFVCVRVVEEITSGGIGVLIIAQLELFLDQIAYVILQLTCKYQLHSSTCCRTGKAAILLPTIRSEERTSKVEVSFVGLIFVLHRSTTLTFGLDLTLADTFSTITTKLGQQQLIAIHVMRTMIYGSYIRKKVTSHFSLMNAMMRRNGTIGMVGR